MLPLEAGFSALRRYQGEEPCSDPGCSSRIYRSWQMKRARFPGARRWEVSQD